MRKGILFIIFVCLLVFWSINLLHAYDSRVVYCMITYDAYYYDPTVGKIGKHYPETIPEFASGPSYLLSVGLIPGVSGSDVKKVIIIHKQEGEIVERFVRFRPNLLKEFSTRIGLVYAWKEIGFYERMKGKWIFKIVFTDGEIEIFSADVDHFRFPPKPTNIKMKVLEAGNEYGAGTGSVFLEWSASAGPPNWYDNNYLAFYRIKLLAEEYYQELESIDADKYDTVNNRVSVILPPHWSGRRIRLTNGIQDGGASLTPDGGISHFSRSKLFIRCR